MKYKNDDIDDNESGFEEIHGNTHLHKCAKCDCLIYPRIHTLHVYDGKYYHESCLPPIVRNTTNVIEYDPYMYYKYKGLPSGDSVTLRLIGKVNEIYWVAKNVPNDVGEHIVDSRKIYPWREIMDFD